MFNPKCHTTYYVNFIHKNTTCMPFLWIGGSYKPVKLDKCDGYSDNFDYLTIYFNMIKVNLVRLFMN